jgi:hypothetical protein
MTTTQETPTDAEINAALDIIRVQNPRAALSCIAALDDAGARGDRLVFAQAALDIVALAAAVQRDQPAPPKQAPQQPQQRPAPDLIDQLLEEHPPDRPLPRLDPTTRRVLGGLACLFGLALWAPGAHYTLDGWTLGANIILTMVRSEWEVPLARGPLALALLVLFGIAYSVAERRSLPVRFWRITDPKTKQRKLRGRFLGGGVVLVWLLVNGTDLGSTYAGIMASAPLCVPGAAHTGATPWPITCWMVTTIWAAISWSIVVTYVGDILLFLGWRWLKG